MEMLSKTTDTDCVMELALPENEGSLYQIALEVERDRTLSEEMQEWRETLIGDGIRCRAIVADHL